MLQKGCLLWCSLLVGLFLPTPQACSQPKDSLKSKTFKTVEVEVTQHNSEESFLPIKNLSGLTLESLKGGSLGNLLSSIPGITRLQTGPNIAKPTIRGLQGSRIAIWVNSVRLEGQQWGNEHAPEADPMLYSNISIVKGAATVKYGTEASGGAIVIDPDRDEAGQPFKLAIGALGATNGRQLGTQFKASGSVGKGFFWSTAGNWRNSGDVYTADYFIKNSGIRELSGIATLGYTENRWGIRMHQSAFFNRIGIFPGAHIGNVTDLLSAIANPDTVYKANFGRAIIRPSQEISHFISQFSFWYLFPQAGKLNIRLARQFNERLEFDSHRPFRVLDPNSPELSFKLRTHTADLSWQTAHNEHVDTECGIQLTTQGNVVEGRILIPNFRSWFAGIYALHRYHLADWNLELGLRYDYRTFTTYENEAGVITSINKTYQGFSSHSSIFRNIGQYHSIRLNAQTAFRAPNVNELFSDGVHHGSAAYEKGNSGLKSERSLGGQLTYLYKNHGFSFSAEPWFTHYNSFIFLQPQNPETVLTIRGAFPLFNWAQANVNMLGVESELSKEILSGITLKLTAAIQRNRNVSDNNWLIFSPANQFQFFIRKQWTGDDKSLFIEPSLVMVSRQNLVPQGVDFAPAPKGYRLLNAQIGYTDKGEHIDSSIFLTCNNLLNTSYRDYLNRMRYFILDPGRNIQVRVVFEFHNHHS